MDLKEAIISRHSVRNYHHRAIPAEIVQQLDAKISEVNSVGNLHVQLVLDEPKGFSGIMAYGKFSGVTNYLVMAGPKDDTLSERIGYYGEQLVLLAQCLGLNTCWAGLSYRKVAGTYSLGPGEKIGCYIALGYGKTPGVAHKVKTQRQISNATDITPRWFNEGVRAAQLAPTAINQQKFFFEYLGDNRVKAYPGFSLVGYTHMDLGIAKLHFEIGADCPVKWVK